jgi:hypothetical protein
MRVKGPPALVDSAAAATACVPAARFTEAPCCMGITEFVTDSPPPVAIAAVGLKACAAGIVSLAPEGTLAGACPAPAGKFDACRGWLSSAGAAAWADEGPSATGRCGPDGEGASPFALFTVCGTTAVIEAAEASGVPLGFLAEEGTTTFPANIRGVGTPDFGTEPICSLSAPCVGKGDVLPSPVTGFFCGWLVGMTEAGVRTIEGALGVFARALAGARRTVPPAGSGCEDEAVAVAGSGFVAFATVPCAGAPGTAGATVTAAGSLAASMESLPSISDASV